ncbi:glycoside hydrolase family 3 protein [Flavobacterium algicola]|uniref:glycoside hydrolase family 3 protein n=1 Tax=Flavobacterium algicola TaxID=556529 RepID=UPI001EFE7719|nr:glycoside hydrolase family 3 N-terminal domain-containing protein [Flavobacterium algicola]MCG9793560.1 glycoside hydrolase family 3 protein [Flavobacterium algicola]
MTLKQKIGHFFFPAVFINDTEENIQATEKLIRECHIGGLTFFHSRASAATNYESKKKVVYTDDSYERLKALIIRYQKAASTPLLMSIDAEWGLAMRVEKTPQYPYALTLGALPDSQSQLVYEVGKQIGLDLKAVGIQYNLAPLADINNNPNNPVIGYRSFGDDKNKVAHFALEYLRGMNDVNVLGCLKHFPGHGNTNVDSHLGLPILKENLEELLENELIPFIEGIKNGVDSIMIGHLAVPALNNGKNTSATLSKAIIEDLLRTKLQYKGLVISDALNMHSVSNLYEVKGELEWEAFNAGNDVLCFAENVEEGIKAILSKATPERIEESYQRILACKEKVGLFESEVSIEDSPDFEAASVLNKKIAESAITTLRDNQNYHLITEASKDDRLGILSIYKNAENAFSKTLSHSVKATSFAIENGDAIEESDFIKKSGTLDTVIIALFVPKAKPMQKFEIEESVLIMIAELFESKKCILYLFGNPYALQVIPNLKAASGIVQVYQDFDEFQETAANLLITNTPTLGRLPVTINNL